MPADGGKAEAPRRSREQRLRALQQANEIRSARAQLNRDLASGRIELARILVRPPEFAQISEADPSNGSTVSPRSFDGFDATAPARLDGLLPQSNGASRRSNPAFAGWRRAREAGPSP
jgi:hypothetical protein